MKTIIQSPHIKVTEKLQRTMEQKFEKLDRLFDRIELCSIVLKQEKNNRQENCITEAKLSVPGNDLFATAKAASFETAADKVYLEIESQLRKHKAKLTKKATLPGDHFANDEELE